MNWDDIRVFLAVARSASMSAAARHLKVNQSTVSRRLRVLEARLDARLIERNRDGHVLSQAGEELMQTAERLEAEMQAAEAKIAGRDASVAGRLRVTCADILLDQFLAPYIAEFCAAHPQIGLEIVSTFEPVDLMRREADVALRVSARPPDVLVGRRLCGFRMAAYAHHELASWTDGCSSHEELDWIGWAPPDQSKDVISAQFPNANIRHRTDGLVAARAMVRAGLGASVFPCYWADADPNLVRIFPEPVPDTGLGLWVLAHPDIYRTARVRAFANHMANAISAARDRFEGTHS